MGIADYSFSLEVGKEGKQPPLSKPGLITLGAYHRLALREEPKENGNRMEAIETIMNLRHIKGLLLTIAYVVGIAYGTMLALQSYAQSLYIVLTIYIVVMAFISVNYVRYMLKCMRGREPYEKPMEERGE